MTREETVALLSLAMSMLGVYEKLLESAPDNAAFRATYEEGGAAINRLQRAIRAADGRMRAM